MPHPENIVGKGTPFTADTASIAGKKGQSASVRARRAKKEAREVAQMVLNLKPQLSDKAVSSLRKMSLRGKSPDVRLISTIAIAQKSMHGDIGAYRCLTDLAGETAEAKMAEARAEEAIRHTGLLNAQMLDLDTKSLRERMDNLSDEDLATYERLCSILNPADAEEQQEQSADDVLAEALEQDDYGSTEGAAGPRDAE